MSLLMSYAAYCIWCLKVLITYDYELKKHTKVLYSNYKYKWNEINLSWKYIITLLYINWWPI
jgi:hypothetical protein